MTGSLRGHKFQLTRAEHGAVGSLHHSDRPQDEGEREDGKRDVAVGDLADRGAVQDVVGPGTRPSLEKTDTMNGILFYCGLRVRAIFNYSLRFEGLCKTRS
jgi:hypothetical protein